MIPVTYPSILDSSNRTKMLVYQVPSITGLTRWIDYIPVKSPTSESDLTLANTFANEGFILTSKVNDITGLVPFKDYVPIYLDSTATKAWSANNDGYIPMAELAGLLLDFTTGSLDARINFTRTTNATVTNSAGQITYAPHNLLTYSEQFDNAAWTKTATTVTSNAMASPTSTTTGDTLTAGGANSTTLHSYTAIAQPYTFSIYIRRRTGTGAIEITADGSTYVAKTITSDWTRFDTTITPTTGTRTPGVRIVTSGDAIDVWGAQLEIGSTATTYNSTSVKNLLGYSELFDNAAWTKSNSFVQTNLLTYSEAFDNVGWTKSNAVITANDIIAPNGYQTADKLVETAVSGNHYFYNAATITFASYPQGLVASVYVKAGERSRFYLGYSSGGNLTLTYATFNLTTQETSVTNLFGWSVATASIEPVGNGWYRCSFRVSTNGSAYNTNLTMATIDNSGNISYTGDGTSGLYIWGAQLVQGSVAGDYRRTDAAALPVYYPNHNGVVCAEKLVENTATNEHRISLGSITTTANPWTASVYAKAGERNFVWIRYYDSGVVQRAAWFNLATGAVGTTQTNVTASIVSLGNGWYRCSSKISPAFAGATNTVEIGVSSTDNVTSYAGDGTSGIYIFGAQLSDSASLDTYVLNAAAAPTAAAYYGARFDYDPVTLAPKGLLIEEQRSNMLLNSTIAGTNLATQNVTVTAVAHTLSFYGTGNIVLSGTASATLTGTGAYPTRSTLTFTPTAGTLTLTVTGIVQYAQLEIGSFATSFIPTAASQVTRAADVATIQGSNFYSWYNQNEGSVSAKVSSLVAGNFQIDDETANNRITYINRLSGTGTVSSAIVNSAGVVDLSVSGWTSGVNNIAAGYKVDNYAGVINNGTVATDTSAGTPIVNTLRISGSTTTTANFTFKSISYYPQKLSSDVLKGLTA